VAQLGQIPRPLQEKATDHELRILLAIVEDGLVTPIARGENAGRTLTSDHVVRRLDELFPLAPGGRAAKGVSVVLPPGWKRDRLSVIVFAQDPKTLRIEAAVEVR
jgi:hypothetical protein